MVSGLAAGSHRLESLTSEMFAEDGHSGPRRISQQKAVSQMGAQDSILRQQVFIVQQKLLIHHPGHVR